MRSPVGAIAVWAAAALGGPILAGCGGQDPAPSPVGVWEIADPEAAAREELSRLRSLKYSGEPNSVPQAPEARLGTTSLPPDSRGRSDKDVLADLVRIGRSVLLEFRDDGTYAHNFAVGQPGTWSAVDGRVQAVSGWPARPPAPGKPPLPGPSRTEFRFDGVDLLWEQDPRESHHVRLRRSRRTFAPPADLELVAPDAVPR